MLQGSTNRAGAGLGVEDRKELLKTTGLLGVSLDLGQI